MKIYSADTWTIEELKDQIDDAGRRALVIPAADTQRAVLETFSEMLDVAEDSGLDLDVLHDSLQDVADAVAEDGQAPVTFIWQVPAAFPRGPVLRCPLRNPPGRGELRCRQPGRRRRLPLTAAFSRGPAAENTTLKNTTLKNTTARHQGAGLLCSLKTGRQALTIRPSSALDASDRASAGPARCSRRSPSGRSRGCR